MTDSQRKKLRLIALLACALAGPRSTAAADTTKYTWPGDLDGPKSLWVSQASLLLIGIAGEEADAVGGAKGELATSTQTSNLNDNSSHGASQQLGNSTITLSHSAHHGHVIIDTVVVAHDTYSASGQALGSQEGTAILHLEVSPCPEVDGVAGGQISVQLRQEATYPDGSRTSSTAVAEGPFRIVNGDDAYRVRTDMDLTLSGGNLHVAPGASPADPVAWGLSGPLNLSWGTGGPATASAGTEAEWSWAGDFPKEGISQSPADVVAMKTLFFLEKRVEEFWRTNQCITLKPSEEDRDVDPGEKVEVTVESEQKFDQQEVKAPIKAELTGAKSIDPKGKPVDEPAKFDFVAGGKHGDDGYIEFTQTGKRGIGQKKVRFKVRATKLMLTCTGDYDFFSGVYDDKGKVHVVLPATELTLQEDGTFRGTGNLKVTGRINLADRYPEVHMRTGFKVDHTEIDYTNPVGLIAKPDAKDPSLVRVQITPEPTDHLSTLVLRNGQRRPSGMTGAVELWGRIMANRPTSIGRETVVKDSLTSGAKVVATTTLRVSYPEQSKP